MRDVAVETLDRPLVPMATSKNLQRKLKASAKRRTRRIVGRGQSRAPEASSPNDGSGSGSDAADASGGSQASPQRIRVDVGGLIAKTILDFASARSPLRDAVVVSALRSCFQGTTPSGDQSRQLSERLAAIPAQHDVPVGAFRKEIDEMLSLAKRQRDADQTDAFVQLLRMLTQ